LFFVSHLHSIESFTAPAHEDKRGLPSLAQAGHIAKETSLAVTTFAVPILPDKTDAWKEAAASLNGDRKNDFEDFNRRFGITRHVASLQQTPQGDFAVVCIEGDDPDHVLGKMQQSDHPFERWFVATFFEDIHGIMPSEGPPPPNIVFIDYTQ